MQSLYTSDSSKFGEYTIHVIQSNIPFLTWYTIELYIMRSSHYTGNSGDTASSAPLLACKLAHLSYSCVSR